MMTFLCNINVSIQAGMPLSLPDYLHPALGLQIDATVMTTQQVLQIQTQVLILIQQSLYQLGRHSSLCESRHLLTRVIDSFMSEQQTLPKFS